MRDITFYQEFANRSKTKPTGNAMAVWRESTYTGAYDAIVALREEPNSVVASGSVTSTYLHERCKRISETKAREVHPALFERLENN